MKIIVSIILILWSWVSFAQQLQVVKYGSKPKTTSNSGQLSLVGSVIWQENFESPGNSFPYNGITTTSADASSNGFSRGDNSASNKGPGFVVPAHTRFAFTNDDYCNCNKSQDELILPTITFSGASGVILQFDAYFNRATGLEKAEVFVESGSNWLLVGKIKSNSSWQRYEFVIKGAGINNPKLKFVYSDGGLWGTGLAIDNIGVFNATNQADLRADSLTLNGQHNYEFYSQIPLKQANNYKVAVHGALTNMSSKSTTGTMFQTHFKGQMKQTDNLQIGRLAGLATSQGFTNQYVYLNQGKGSYTVLGYPVSDSTDNDNSNDTLKQQFEVNDTIYSRIKSNTPQQYLWYGPDVEYAIFSKIDITAQDTATSISVFLDKNSRIGDSIDVLIYSEFLQDKVKDTFPQINEGIELKAEHLGKWVSFKIPQSTLTPGIYYVGIRTHGKQVLIGSEEYPVQKTMVYTSTGGQFTSTDYLPFINLNLRGSSCPVLLANASSTSSGCSANNGIASVAPSGGTAPYQIRWGKKASYSTSTSVSALAAGNYQVNISDTMGCSITEYVAVSDSNAPMVTVDSVANEKCFGDSLGYIRLAVSGGTPPYTATWSDGSTGLIRNKLTAGSFNVEVKDNSSSNCLANEAIAVEGPKEELIATSTSSNNICATDTNAQILWKIRGGVEPYSWSWSDTSLKSLHETNLLAGNYKLTVTGNFGCNYIDSVKITSNDSILVSGVVDDTGKTASITLTVSGGVNPYTYLWKGPGSFVNPGTQNLTGLLDQGNYIVTTTDSVGCFRTDTFVVAGNISVYLARAKANSYKLYPNPSNGLFQIVSLNKPALIHLHITDQLGKVVSSISEYILGTPIRLNKGLYWIHVKEQNGNSTVLKALILE